MHNAAQNNRRMAINTMLLYIRMIFLMGVTLYTSRVVLQVLGVNDFGLYNVVAGFVSMFSFLNAAMTGATQRFLNYQLGRGDDRQLGRVFATGMIIHAAISLTVVVLAETIGLWFVHAKMQIPPGRMQAALWVYHTAILSTVVMIMSVPYNAAIISRERMGAFAYISIMEAVLKLAIVFVLMATPIDKLQLYAILMLLVQVLVCAIYAVYCRRHFKETRARWVIDRQLLGQMTGFAGWNLFGNIAAVAYTQGLNVLLNMFFGPAVNAARGIAVQVQNAIRGFCSNFQMAVNPQITKQYAAGDLPYMHTLIFASSKYSYYLLLMLSLPVMIEAGQILQWWLGMVPQHTVVFVRIILAVSMVEALAQPVVQGALSTGKIRTYQMVVGGLLLCILPVSYLALKAGAPPHGVFMVHLAMAVVAHVARLYMSRPLFDLSLRQYGLRVVAPIAGVTLLAVVPPCLVAMVMTDGLLRFLCVGTVCVVSVGGAVALAGLNKDERRFVRGKLVTLACKVKGRAPKTPANHCQP